MSGVLKAQLRAMYEAHRDWHSEAPQVNCEHCYDEARLYGGPTAQTQLERKRAMKRLLSFKTLERLGQGYGFALQGKVYEQKFERWEGFCHASNASA